MKKILFLAVISASMMLASCEDFLTADNKSSVTDRQQFSTKEGFESLVYDAYANIKTVYTAVSDYQTLFYAGTDMYTLLERNQTTNTFHQYQQLNPENSTVDSFYTRCYDAIRAAYQVLYYAPGAQIDDELRNKRVDEARVIAAHYYYLLVNTFGGVPLIKRFVDTASTGYPRATTEEVYKYIISELEGVVANNYLGTTSSGGGRVTMQVAKAQLAQVYLAAAWDLKENSYFKKAAEMADEVIDANPEKGLTKDFAASYKSDRSGDDNAEFIWDLEYDYATAHAQTNGGHSWETWLCAYIGANTDNVKAVTQGFVASVAALHRFAEGDTRYDATFMKEMSNFTAGQETGYWTWYANGESLKGYPVLRYYAAWYESKDTDFPAWQALDAANRQNTFFLPMDTYTYDPTAPTETLITYESSTNQTWGGATFRKYDDSESASKNGSNCWRDIHIITLSEMYFVAAEAYLQAGDAAKAAERIATVRERAFRGCTKSQIQVYDFVADSKKSVALADYIHPTSVTLDDILAERSCELFGEGKRWFDLRRTGKLVEYNQKYNPYVGSNAQAWVKTLRPIPQGAIDANDQLSAADQNPGY